MSDFARGLDADVIIVGGGIVGVSTALSLSKAAPGISILLLEKEDALANHQTGHNSGVVHAGVYYAPGSLKAKFCRDGARAIYDFANRHEIAAERCGKLVVATNALEVERLNALYTRAKKNGLEPQFIGKKKLAEIEPNVRGLKAMLVGESGITDYPAITRKMAELAGKSGTTVGLGVQVRAIEEQPNGVKISTTRGDFRAGLAILCGGLMADKLGKMCKLDLDFRIVPFRGEYFKLPASHNSIVNHLIYPVPDPALPFLGVHLTRMIDGSVTIGPNAVLALSREGYRWRDIDVFEISGTLSYPGLWKLIAAQFGATMSELRGSLSRSTFLERCRRYCPSLTMEDLLPHPAGVRAQALMRDGSFAHDFLIRKSTRCLHVCNAPSPAATSAIPIGAYLAQEFISFRDGIT